MGNRRRVVSKTSELKNSGFETNKSKRLRLGCELTKSCEHMISVLVFVLLLPVRESLGYREPFLRKYDPVSKFSLLH